MTTTTPDFEQIAEATQTRIGFAGERYEAPVDEVMTPGVVTLTEDMTLTQVRRALLSHGADGVLVVGRLNGVPLGWVTARGLLDQLRADPWLCRAGDIVTERPNVISPSGTVLDAARMLSAAGVSRLLVAGDGGRGYVGVVTAMDLLKASR